MKTLKIIACGLLISLIASCATPEEMAEANAKYEFANLTEVNNISNWRLDSWDVIDNKSLVVETSPNESYLFVLNFPVQELRSAVAIIVSSSGGRVEARFDTVATARAPQLKSNIQTIYQLDNDEQIAMVKEQITSQ